jgi:hypothetical protein
MPLKTKAVQTREFRAHGPVGRWSTSGAGRPIVSGSQSPGRSGAASECGSDTRGSLQN